MLLLIWFLIMLKVPAPLMLSALKEAQRARRHTFVLGPEAFILEPGDIISWTSERNGYINKDFRVDGVGDQSQI